MSESPVAPGRRLKAEREHRGLSVQKAADELHLDAWVVDALEIDDYQRVGPSVYAKGHLKRYAALLGLPAAEILAGYEFRARASQPPASQLANMRRDTRTDPPAINNLPWPQIAGCVAAVLLIIGVLWWKPWHQRGAMAVSSAVPAATSSAASSERADDSAGATGAAASPTMSPSSMSSTTTTPSVAGAPMQASRSGAAVAKSASSLTSAHAAVTPAVDATAGVGRARLRLSFSADSWVDVHDAAGRRAFTGHGRANSVKTIAGIAPMRVYLGFASGVQLEINDRAVAIGRQFVAGDVAHFEAGADGVLRRDSRNPQTRDEQGRGVQTRNARPLG